MKKIFALLVITVLVSCGSESNKKNDTTENHTMPSNTEDSSMKQPEIPENAKVYFVNLKDGDIVKSPFKVQMGAEGIATDSAGHLKPASGHHHILIDVADSIAYGLPVPKDENNLHFGNAQKETELTLKAGKHKLSLQYADGLHRSYGSKLNVTISVTVK